MLVLWVLIIPVITFIKKTKQNFISELLWSVPGVKTDAVFSQACSYLTFWLLRSHNSFTWRRLLAIASMPQLFADLYHLIMIQGSVSRLWNVCIT